MGSGFGYLGSRGKEQFPPRKCYMQNLDGHFQTQCVEENITSGSHFGFLFLEIRRH